MTDITPLDVTDPIEIADELESFADTYAIRTGDYETAGTLHTAHEWLYDLAEKAANCREEHRPMGSLYAELAAEREMRIKYQEACRGLQRGMRRKNRLIKRLRSPEKTDNEKVEWPSAFNTKGRTWLFGYRADRQNLRDPAKRS